MSEWYVTFGQRYPREPHPTFPDAHRDGYVVIEALDEDQAWVIACTHLSQYWSIMYDASAWAFKTSRLFPRGELARWSS